MTLMGAASHATASYVSDQLEVTLRAGESVRYKILRMLPSGTPLDVLSTNSESGYARVRADDGVTGYVLEHQLQLEPVARVQVAEMKARLDEFMKEPDSLARQLASLQAEHEALGHRAAKLEKENQALSDELAEIRHASTHVVEITAERERLQDQVSALARERDQVQEENAGLRERTNQRWFLIGSGVMGGGIFLGLILPLLRPRHRKSSWDRL
ncbi:TIGR04211 family SH3 domain-containing protein [Thiorhodococcus mannitoliphagus]|uniref:TIGR04211 family SH3 domain-containing protein n=2 Tax=Thiorhodococcus mannitoliphagus TaxID=329406 RepID=A0A6P1DTH1_9GAMM|nr:TIGR04211 family SH3 domain-containing protein [Thiorhodococcus mannitoliphagus]